MTDKLYSLEECERFAQRQDTEADIYKQLVDVMRENEHLHEKLAKWEVLYCNLCKDTDNE